MVLQTNPVGIRDSYYGCLGEKVSATTRSRVVLIVTNVISVGCLIWSLRDVRLGALLNDLATMNWWWVALAVVADIAVYCWQGWRWSLLLHPIEPVSFGRTVRAIYVGLFANEVLPFKAGELLRCYLISRWTALPFSVSLSSAIIERIFDGIWLCLCLIVTLRIVPRPGHMRALVVSESFLAIAVLIGVGLLAVAMFRRHHAHALLEGGTWKRNLRVLIDDLSLIGHSRYLYLALLQSLPYLLLQVIPIYASFRGYGFDDLTLVDAFALLVILRLGSFLPQAPGNLGVFQFMAAESLIKIFNVVPDQAHRFAQVLWGIVTLPLLIGGVVALSVTGARIGELRRAAHAESADLSKSRQ
jgi:glycosyltransferase 2 family protein